MLIAKQIVICKLIKMALHFIEVCFFNNLDYFFKGNFNLILTDIIFQQLLISDFYEISDPF